MMIATSNTNINTLEDVAEAKRVVKRRISFREKDLNARLEQLPQETFKATIGLVIPAFINNKIAGRSWNLVKDAIGILSPFTTDKASLWKDVAKQVGVVGLAKAALGLFKK